MAPGVEQVGRQGASSFELAKEDSAPQVLFSQVYLSHHFKTSALGEREERSSFSLFFSKQENEPLPRLQAPPGLAALSSLGVRRWLGTFYAEAE